MATSSEMPLASQILVASLAGSSAGVFSNPIEVIKTRFQLQGELGKGAVLYKSMRHCCSEMVRKEGWMSLQKGLSASIAYQVALNGPRLGTYPTMKAAIHTLDPEGKHETLTNAVAGMVCGALGAAVGAPAFLTKVRLQTLNKSSSLSSSSGTNTAVGHQHRITGLRDGLQLALRQGGMRGLWRGSSAQVIRVMMGSAVQLSSYDWIKCRLRDDMGIQEGIPLQFLSSSIAGVCVAIGMNPADLISSRVTNQPVDPVTHRGVYYRGTFHCLVCVVRTEGIFGLWKGVFAHMSRIVPHSILTFLFWEQYFKLVHDHTIT